MDKKLMVYPYNAELEALVRHRDLLKSGYELFSVVTASDAGLCNKKIIGSDFKITIDYRKALENCDAVFFNEWNSMNYQLDKLYRKIDMAIDMGKDVILNVNFEKRIIHDIGQKCKSKGVEYTNLNMNEKVKSMIPAHLTDIYTPVLFIGSLANKCNKFEIQLALRKLLIRNGYQVSQIGTKNYCELLGFHSFPGFMFSKDYSEVDKILLFNQLVHEIEKKENPDIIVIGLPGSVIPFNNIVHNNFGIISYLVSQALHPDFTIISTLFDYYQPLFFEKIKNTISHKLGFDIDCFNVSSSIMDFYDNENFEKEKFINVDIEIVEEALSDVRKLTDLSVINIYNHKDLDLLYKLIVEQLSNPTSEVIAIGKGGGS